MKVATLNSNKDQYPTVWSVSQENVLIKDNIPTPEHLSFLLVTSDIESKKYNRYILETLRNIGGFKEIYNETELESLIIKIGITDKVHSITNVIGLHNLSKEVGNFLVMKTSMEYVGTSRCIFEINISDPSTRKVIYHVKREGLISSGLDRPVFNPVFNDYITWVRENEHRTKVKMHAAY